MQFQNGIGVLDSHTASCVAVIQTAGNCDGHVSCSGITTGNCVSQKLAVLVKMLSLNKHLEDTYIHIYIHTNIGHVHTYRCKP